MCITICLWPLYLKISLSTFIVFGPRFLSLGVLNLLPLTFWHKTLPFKSLILVLTFLPLKGTWLPGSGQCILLEITLRLGKLERLGLCPWFFLDQSYVWGKLTLSCLSCKKIQISNKIIVRLGLGNVSKELLFSNEVSYNNRLFCNRIYFSVERKKLSLKFQELQIKKKSALVTHISITL